MALKEHMEEYFSVYAFGTMIILLIGILGWQAFKPIDCNTCIHSDSFDCSNQCKCTAYTDPHYSLQYGFNMTRDEFRDIFLFPNQTTLEDMRQEGIRCDVDNDTGKAIVHINGTVSGDFQIQYETTFVPGECTKMERR